jgi:shikimate dehydrogenase
MQYGLIGKSLGHSFSRELHARISDYRYELCEIAENELSSFMKQADFLGINVTIPYKKAVIPHLYKLDSLAERVGAVNTVVKRGGRLYGYNTDVLGLIALIRSSGVGIRQKKCAILGTGGTSNAARVALSELCAGEILTVSRRCGEGVITYSELYEKHSDVEVIINTTPVGMYPSTDASPIRLSHFGKLMLVADAIYNPLRTALVSEALSMGITALGGLYMLVAQAVYASALFRDKSTDESDIKSIYDALFKEKENIVLIGMPSCGKTTVGRALAEKLSRPFIDTDEEISKRKKMSIPEIFKLYGEKHFRDIESEVIGEISKSQGLIISTGGGAVLRGENVKSLKQNGRLILLEREFEKLIFTNDRPLSKTRGELMRLYEERFPVYSSVKDTRVDANGSVDEVKENILKEIGL